MNNFVSETKSGRRVQSGGCAIHCQDCSISQLCIPFTLNEHELDQLGDLLVTDLIGMVEHIGIEAETRRRSAVIPPDALGLHEFVDPSVIVPSSGRGIGLVPGESGRRGIDVGDLQGAGMHRIPLIDQCRLSLLRLIAQAPHPSPGII